MILFQIKIDKRRKVYLLASRSMLHLWNIKQTNPLYFSKTFSKNMRNLLFIAVIFWLNVTVLSSQACLPNGIIFSRQGQIDSFPLNYPGCKVIGGIKISSSDPLTSTITNVDSLYVIDSIVGSLEIKATAITNLEGFSNLKSVSNSIFIHYNNRIKNFYGLHQINHLGGGMQVQYNDSLTTLNAFTNLTETGSIEISNNPQLINLEGPNQLEVLDELWIYVNDRLVDFSALNSLKIINNQISIYANQSIININGFENLEHLDGYLQISNNPSLQQLPAFKKLKSVGTLSIGQNNALTTLSGLDSLREAGILYIQENSALVQLTGLEQLRHVSVSLFLRDLPIQSLAAFSSLDSIQGNFEILGCYSLTSLEGLQNLKYIGGYLFIHENPLLSNCAAAAVCSYLANPPDIIIIEANAPGCNSENEVVLQCGGSHVFVHVVLDDGDCNQDSILVPASDIAVRLTKNNISLVRPTDTSGVATLAYIGLTPFAITLPQFPNSNWEICQDTFWIFPDSVTVDTNIVFLLKPLGNCPQLLTDLHLPSFFRGCLVNSPIKITTKNVGTAAASNTKVAVVIPNTLSVVSTIPPIFNTVGDTLYFDTGDLIPFQSATVTIMVHTSCDTFLLGSTLCLEALSFLDNPCPPIQETSDVRVYSECLSDTTVRFNLKNILSGATQNPHEYIIIEDEIVLMANPFNLGPYGSMTVDVPANGATYRMEATQLEDGTLTATANEGCGGFTPGFVTAFWLNYHLSGYDYDCREVVLAYDPNQKTAIPKGIGEQHLLPANRPITYTIDFQNTGTDTAFRVLLRDVLSQHLDVTTFRPGASSNPYTWEIRGLDTLEVLFQPIMLPDSTVNEAASHGWFSFTIDQQPDLADGTYIKNTASIIFDYNPPIITNTTFHTIGELTVSVDEVSQQHAGLWKVLGNPTITHATLLAVKAIPGEKKFELVNTAGRVVRSQAFSGQRFNFERENLPAGLYYFTITDQQGRVFSGKIMVK